MQWERKCARAILRLAQQFPNDAGAMAPLFLNYLLMAPGESFFMAANEPHAYVAGEIIEVCQEIVIEAPLLLLLLLTTQPRWTLPFDSLCRCPLGQVHGV